MTRQKNRYVQIIERIFLDHYTVVGFSAAKAPDPNLAIALRDLSSEHSKRIFP
jgi:hypothetical protein